MVNVSNATATMARLLSHLRHNFRTSFHNSITKKLLHSPISYRQLDFIPLYGNSRHSTYLAGKERNRSTFLGSLAYNRELKSFLLELDRKVLPLVAFFLGCAAVGICLEQASAESRETEAEYKTKGTSEKNHHTQEVVTKEFEYYTGRKFNPRNDKIRIFAGNANPELAQLIAHYLGTQLGKAEVSRFADGEISIKICENVRGKDVYVIQPICPPLNDSLIEALLLTSTLRRSSARTISLVMPYYAYARSDRRLRGRMPIAARDVACMLETAGADHVLTVDIHAGQIQGFFSSKVQSDNLSAIHVGAVYFSEMRDLKNPAVVSITANGVHRAKTFWQVLSSHRKYFDQSKFVMAINSNESERWEPEAKNPIYEIVGANHLIGSDAIIVTDIVDTAVPLCKVAEELHKAGARRVFAFSSHGLFSGNSLQLIHESPLEKVVVTNTVTTASTPRLENKRTDKIIWLSLAPLLAECIYRVHENESVSDLFKT